MADPLNPADQTQATSSGSITVESQKTNPFIQNAIGKTDEISSVTSTDFLAPPTEIDAEVIATGVDEQAQKKFNKNLVKINRQAKEKSTQEKARELGLSYIDIAATPINPDLLKLIPPEEAKSALLMPFFRLGKKLRITVADPTSPTTRATIESLKTQGYAININLASDDGILEALRLYSSPQYRIKKELDTNLDEEKIKAYEQELETLKQLPEKIKAIPSEEAVYLINVGAYKTGASDIHIEPEEKFVRFRFRIDGILHEIFTIDKSVHTNFVNQLKYQCKMKLNINNEPQDGRYNFTINDRKIDVRVSALPTEFGETFVCRLLDSGRHLATFEELGFSGANLRKIERLTKISHGMILVTGPTGSGKTTSLYTMLSKFNSPEAKIITLEDPIEYHLEGISQSQINEKRNYNFAEGLRAVLRQDPNVVMIGEIRDLETAQTASQAALTGHVVLSTLHTNSAIESIPRLINVGLPPFMVAPALNSIIAQRLVRKLCTNCQVLRSISEAKKEELKQIVDSIKKVQPALEVELPEKLSFPAGCELCSHTGYKGRVCIVEMLEVDFEIKDLILNKASTTKMIEAARRKGMLTMKEDGVLKVLNGETTLEEVYRVTSVAI